MKALISIPHKSPPSSIEDALLALVKGQLKPSSERQAAALAACGSDKLVAQIVARGAAPVGTTTGTGFAKEIVQNLVGDFLATLAPLSAAAYLISQGLQIQLSRAAELKLPAREGAPSTTVGWVGEAEPVPVRQFAVNQDCVLSPRKFGFIIGVTRELAKRGEAAIRQLIREDAAASLDAAYFNDGAGSADAHAGMLAGMAALAGYAGGDAVAMETDLNALAAAVGASHEDHRATNRPTLSA